MSCHVAKPRASWFEDGTGKKTRGARGPLYAASGGHADCLNRGDRGGLTNDCSVSVERNAGSHRGRGPAVGLSYNAYRWHPEIDPEAGVVRLVFGLGTRAVDRNDEDYTRLVALNTPLRRPEASIDEQIDHSQRNVDVLDLDARELVLLPVETLAPVCGDFPSDLFLDKSPNGLPWVTFRMLLRDTPVAEGLRRMLRVLAEAYQHPVDVEFAVNFLPDGSYRIHLLQCRTFQIQKDLGGDGNDPSNLPGRRILESRGAVIGIDRESQVHDILHVPVQLYAALAERDRYQVAKLIETLK